MLPTIASHWNFNLPSCQLVGNRIRRSKKLEHRSFVTRPMKLVVPDDNASHIATHLKAICAGHLSRIGNEHARGAVGVFQVSRNLVLNGDVMVFSETTKPPYPGRHSEQPCHQIELVGALVQKHAAALAVPRRPPLAAGIVGLRPKPRGADPVDSGQLAKLSLDQKLSELAVCGPRSLVEHGRKDLLPVAVGGEKSLAIGLVNRDRFLDKHVQPCLKRRNPLRGVLIVWSADQYSVRRVGLEKFVEILKLPDARCGVEYPSSLLIGVADRGKLAAADFPRKNELRISGPHGTGTDNSQTHVLHEGILLKSTNKEST